MYYVCMYKKVAYNLHNPVKGIEVVVDAFLKNRLEPHSKFVVLDDSLLLCARIISSHFP